MVDVSVILVNYNTKDLLRQCLNSLYDKCQSLIIEIIVSDNDSSDDSNEMLEKEFKDVIIVKNNANLGFGKANNKAINIANGKYLFLLNTDTYLINDAIKILFEFMERDENSEVACCGGDLFKPNGERQASYGNFPTIFDAISQLGFYKLYKQYYNKHLTGGALNYDQNIKVVDYICGADMFLRRSIMDKIGYFDEDFFLYFEETEMSYRICTNGYKSVLVPSAKIVHLEGGGQIDSNVNFFKIKEFSKSRRLYFMKSRGYLISGLIKFIFVFQSLLLFTVKRDSDYLKKAKIIYNN
ncbi:glycosyltransferase family 2 protein [Pedobacter nototheniae]|uniref:glycosyltransferase family 2 protein n=1 Tax=Pedobacter nototheniae TaxID=2488994 RepID=UPI00103E1AF6|nr:glycosyltransferase family 2 protein [Pedobacter nototheniae]